MQRVKRKCILVRSLAWWFVVHYTVASRHPRMGSPGLFSLFLSFPHSFALFPASTAFTGHREAAILPHLLGGWALSLLSLHPLPTAFTTIQFRVRADATSLWGSRSPRSQLWGSSPRYFHVQSPTRFWSQELGFSASPCQWLLQPPLVWLFVYSLPKQNPWVSKLFVADMSLKAYFKTKPKKRELSISFSSYSCYSDSWSCDCLPHWYFCKRVCLSVKGLLVLSNTLAYLRSYGTRNSPS